MHGNVDCEMRLLCAPRRYAVSRSGESEAFSLNRNFDSGMSREERPTQRSGRGQDGSRRRSQYFPDNLLNRGT